MLSLAEVHLVSAVFAAAKSTTPAKSSGGGAEFLIILVLLAGFYFFYARPRRAKLLARQQQAAGTQRAEVDAGDTVVTASGIIGRVLSVDGDRASVEIAPDTVVEFHRSTLGRRLDPEPPDEQDRWATLTNEDSDDHAAEHSAAPDGEHDGGADHTTTGDADPAKRDDEPGGVE